MTDSFKYKAFISYSHSDEKWASWLHKALEAYRPPKQLVGQQTPMGRVPERFAPVFRDREELATSTSLGEMLTEALRASACQIVICSPSAAKSRWTNEEIIAFKRLGKANRIFALIVDGEPGASENPETADLECFPPALIHELGEDNELSDVRSEPIAADARPGKDPRQAAKLKLLAGMLGVGYDDLRQREVQRRQRRLMVLATASLVGMALTSGLAVTAYLARLEAEEQRRIAEIEAETARQTTQFMVGLFEVSDPSESLGNTITAREILDKGVERIDTELADQPAIQATLMETMGTVYTSLGLYNDAVGLLQSSLETRKQTSGAGDPLVSANMNHLGEVLGLSGDFNQAYALHENAYKLALERQAGESLEAAISLSGMGAILTEQGKYAEAVPLYQKSLGIRRKHLPGNHPDIAADLQELGVNLFYQGEYEDAVGNLREALKMRRELYGGVHPDLAIAINDLAWALVEMGELNEAEALYREALGMQRTLLGDQHPEVALALSNVAWTLDNKGDLARAEKLYRQAIDVQRQALGESHPKLAVYLTNLAALLYQKGQIEEAVMTARSSLDLRRRLLGDEHPEVADSAINLAYWFIQMANYDEADRLLEQSLIIRRSTLGEEHPAVASAMILKAGVQVATQRYESARQLAQDAREILEVSLPNRHWRTAAAASVEGAALTGLGAFAEAEVLLLESNEILTEAPMPGVAEESEQRLHELYVAWGKEDQAQKFISAN